jgi:hypothetical protein
MADRVLVPFSGPGEGIEELSWGQRSMWISIGREGRSITLGGIVPLRPGATLRRLADVLSFAMSRHQALRTRLVFGPDGSVRQRVFSSGTLAMEVVEAGEQDPAAVAQRVYDDFTGRDFDYENEWPVRQAIICRHGEPTHTVSVYLHTQLDGLGLQELVADLANLDRETGQALCPAEGLGPLEQARWQRTPAAQRQSDASLRHLEKVLGTVDLERFPLRYPEQEPRFPLLRVDSPALLLATRMLCQQLNIDSSPILLGLYAVATSRLCQQPRFVTLLAVSNRFRPGLAKSVSGLAQVSPCLIELADITLHEALGRARRASVSAYKYGFYDPIARLELVRRITAERGGPVDLSCFFSDRREERSTAGPMTPTLDDVLAALPATTMRWVPQVEEIPEKLYLTVADGEGAIGLQLNAGSQYFSPAEMQELALAMESLAVEAIRDPAATTGIGSIPVAV